MSPCRTCEYQADFSRAVDPPGTVAVSTPIRAAAAENCSRVPTLERSGCHPQSIVDQFTVPPLKKALGSGRAVERQVMVLDRGEGRIKSEGNPGQHGC